MEWPEGGRTVENLDGIVFCFAGGFCQLASSFFFFLIHVCLVCADTAHHERVHFVLAKSLTIH